jgi:Phosphotransferase enzyme family
MSRAHRTTEPRALHEERILAAGRASEIVDLGDGRVLRRFKQGGDPAREAELMTHALRHGYPVPRIDEVRPDGLVLEHVAGPTMAADARRRPWRFAAHARTLARLHEELHRIPMGSGGDVLVHLDLHWKNVLLSRRGPVVIDWANAGAGKAGLDPALTWVILMTSAGPTGRAFARLFSRRVDVRSSLDDAVAYRLADRNLTPAEEGRVRALLASNGARP